METGSDLCPPGAALAPDFPFEFPDVFSTEFDSCRRSCRENVALSERREQNTNSPIRGCCHNVFQFNDLQSREFRRRLELFVEGVAAWEPHVTHLLVAA
jgi:hypothetical protein